MDGLALNINIESSSVIIGGKAAYVGTIVGRWVDMVVKVYSSPVNCSRFLAEIGSRVSL